MPSVATPRSFAIVSYRPARPMPAFSVLRLATAVAAFLLVLVGLGDFWNVYPKAPLPVVTAPVTPSPTAPPATPAPVVVTPEPRLTPAPSTGRIKEPPFPLLTPTVAAPAPEPPVSVATPGTEAPGKVSPVAPELPPSEAAAQGDYIWPVRQVEKGLLATVVVLFILSVVARRWRYARVNRRP